MIHIFSAHVILGVVDPKYSSEEFAELVQKISYAHSIPIGSGMSAIVPRPEPMNEEEEVMQSINPGTHEINLIFDFDPNDKNFLEILIEDSMWNRYSVTNQLCTTVCFAAMKALESVPTYFDIKLSAEYVDEELYKKMKEHVFNLGSE